MLDLSMTKRNVSEWHGGLNSAVMMQYDWCALNVSLSLTPVHLDHTISLLLSLLQTSGFETITVHDARFQLIRRPS